MERSLIYRCEQIIRDIANNAASRINVKPFRQTIAKRLKFDTEDGWNVLCSLMDVLGDTELAKENFLKFSLSGPTKIQDYGEQYLRLYGIVNAVYLQRSALISFIELIKLRDKKSIISKIDSLKIIELRHIVGAHTIDFLDDGKRNPHQFSRGSLEHEPIATSDSKGNYKKYNLKELLLEYNKLASELLIEATEKFITTTQGGQKLIEFKERLELVKEEQDGAIVIYPPHGTEPFVIRVIR